MIECAICENPIGVRYRLIEGKNVVWVCYTCYLEQMKVDPEEVDIK